MNQRPKDGLKLAEGRVGCAHQHTGIDKDSSRTGNKTNSWQMGSHETWKLCTAKETLISGEEAHKMEESLCQFYFWWELVSRIYKELKKSYAPRKKPNF